MIPLPKYVKIKDKYCIAYFGNCNDYLVQLILLRPIMEKSYPGVSVYISYRDDANHLFQNIERTIPKSKLDQNQFAYVRELVYDATIGHPVEKFMEESSMLCGPILKKEPFSNRKCLLVTKGMYPTKSLNKEQIDKAKKMLQQYDIVIDEKIDNPEAVAGVESEELFLKASQGSKPYLISTGIGENVFKNMYPEGSILRV